MAGKLLDNNWDCDSADPIGDMQRAFEEIKNHKPTYAPNYYLRGNILLAFKTKDIEAYKCFLECIKFKNLGLICNPKQHEETMKDIEELL